jgi:hypothetical protein
MAKRAIHLIGESKVSHGRVQADKVDLIEGLEQKKPFPDKNRMKARLDGSQDGKPKRSLTVCTLENDAQ